MKSRILATLTTVILATSVHAGVIGFVSNPTTNSIDFTNAVVGGGGAVTTYTFDDLSVGALDPSAYAGITFGGNISNVAFSAGPSDGNSSSNPRSLGEGPHSASNVIQSGTTNDNLTIDFASSVFGAGFFIVDNFNILGTGTTISAFDSSSSLLGTFAGPNLNFQNNNQYFMGITSSAGDISRIEFSHSGGVTGDRIAIDNLLVAAGGGASVPDTSSTLGLFAGVMMGLSIIRRRLQG